jgi:putative membrane protein
MDGSHRGPRLALAVTLMAGSAWSQTPDPSNPPTAPSITSGPSHTAHPAAGSADSAQGNAAMHQQDARPTAGGDPDPAAATAAADFITKAAIDGMAEVQLGRLALSKSQSDGVLKFAQQMITDYDRANNALGAVATMKNISVPKEIDAPHQNIVQSLSSKQGRAFDTAYIDQMLIAHQRAISLFTAAAGQTDSEIAAFAYKALPTLKTHRQMARSLKGNSKNAA